MGSAVFVFLSHFCVLLIVASEEDKGVRGPGVIRDLTIDFALLASFHVRFGHRLLFLHGGSVLSLIHRLSVHLSGHLCSRGSGRYRDTRQCNWR